MTGPSTVADYMASDLVIFAPHLEINRAVAQLLERGISGAPVLDDAERLLGILTEKDCFRAALNGSYYQEWGGVVADYMSRDVKTIDAGLDVVAAAEQFLASPFRRFPVVSEGRLVGLLSRSDLLRAFNEHW